MVDDEKQPEGTLSEEDMEAVVGGLDGVGEAGTFGEAWLGEAL